MNGILVTGGAGFIGSHTVLVLLQEGFDVFVVDSLKNSFISSIYRVKKFFKKQNPNAKNKVFFFNVDICDFDAFGNVFKEIYSKGYLIDGVIHFAGYKSVSESIKYPKRYWINNVKGTLNILALMKIYNCRNLVFSSSASVYGNNMKSPYYECTAKNPINPYSQTKAFIEDILEKEVNQKNVDLNVVSLRYFNPIGSHDSGLIGECSKGAYDNIFPLINLASNNKGYILQIFGNDWPTYDGTCIRDFIHVMDLSEAHICALNYLSENDNSHLILNIGTGKGTSVLELINIFQEINKVKISYRFASRRDGDVGILFANTNLSQKLLGWAAKRSVSQMCQDGWKWSQKNPSGFKKEKNLSIANRIFKKKL